MRNVLIAFVIAFLVGFYWTSHSQKSKSKGKVTNTATESPYDRMDYQNNITNFTYVRWIQVDNVQKACDDLKGTPYLTPVVACAVYRSYLFINFCSIYSAKRLNMWTLGHEMRHCFQGDFHTLVL
jgi:hypothetical protein